MILTLIFPHGKTKKKTAYQKNLRSYIRIGKRRTKLIQDVGIASVAPIAPIAPIASVAPIASIAPVAPIASVAPKKNLN